MSDEILAAYLFRCGDQDLFAVTLDETGAKLPRTTCTEGWLLRKEFRLGVFEPVPAPIDPDPIIRSINANGYYIWRDPCWAQRTDHWVPFQAAVVTPLSIRTP
jgi:hypothetical protein